MKLHRTTHMRKHKWGHVKTGENQMGSVVYLTLLYQIQFPSFYIVPQSYKMSPLGEAWFKGFYELLLQHPVISNN